MQIDRFNSKKPLIENAYAAVIGGTVLIRSGPIETPEQAGQFLQFIKEKNPASPLKILSCQVNHPENEWELIHSQHRRLAGLSHILAHEGAIAHLNLPIQPFFFDSEKVPSEFLEKTIKKLYRQLNMEGWMTYSRWLNEEMKKVLKTFKPEAADEYQLQARLEDFGIETHSLFIVEVEQELEQVMLDQMDLKGEGESTIFALEKRAIALRERLKIALQIKYVLLNDIVTGISAIEAAHAELFSLKCMTFLLAILLGQEIEAVEVSALTCEQQLLLLQILNQQLGVVTAVNCQRGLERTSIAFSLMLAMSELSQKFSSEELITMVLNWGKADSPAVHEFKRIVEANLEKISLPIVNGVKGSQSKKIPRSMHPNARLLGYLPSEKSHSHLIKQLSDLP